MVTGLVKRSGPGRLAVVAIAVAATFAGVGVQPADASTGPVDIVVEYSNPNYVGSLVVSPDGSLVVVPVYGEVIYSEEYVPPPPLLGVRIVDLTDTTQDQTIIFPVPSTSQSFPPYAFTRDGSLLLVEAEFELFVVDVATMELRPSVPIFDPSLFPTYSPTLEFYYQFAYGDGGVPLLLVSSALTGSIIFSEEMPFAPAQFSRDGERLYVPQGGALLEISVTGDSRIIPFEDSLTLGVPGSVVSESPSGNIVLLEVTGSGGYPRTGLAAVDRAAGRVVAEIPLSSPDASVGIVTYSPDDRLVVFSEFNNSDTGFDSALEIVDLETGEISPWDDALIADYVFSGSFFPVMDSNQSIFFESGSGTLRTIDWDGPTVISERLLGLANSQSSFWEPLKHFPELNELLLVATDANYDNYDYGEWPDRPPSGTVTVTYTFERVALVEETAFTIRGAALGFDETGTIGVSLTTDSQQIISVWDVENQTRLESFPLIFGDEYFSDSGYLSHFVETPRDGQLMVSPDGQTVYLIATRSEFSFDTEIGVTDSIVWAMSTQTGELSEIASFDESGVNLSGYDASRESLLVGVAGFADTSRPTEILEIELTTGQTNSLFSVRDPDTGIARLGEGKLVMFGARGVVALDATTGQRNRQLLFPALADSLRVSVSPDGLAAVGVGTQAEFLPSGEVEPKGGFVAMGVIPGSDGESDQFADSLIEWTGAGAGAATFSPDGTVLYLLTDNGFLAFSVPEGTPLELSPAAVSLPANSLPLTAFLSPDGETMWVGVGSNDVVVAFTPVPLPEIVVADQADETSSQLLPTGTPEWLIPGLVLLASLALVGVWLRRPGNPQPPAVGRRL